MPFGNVVFKMKTNNFFLKGPFRNPKMTLARENRKPQNNDYPLVNIRYDEAYKISFHQLHLRKFFFSFFVCLFFFFP